MNTSYVNLDLACIFPLYFFATSRKQFEKILPAAVNQTAFKRILEKSLGKTAQKHITESEKQKQRNLASIYIMSFLLWNVKTVVM